MSNPDTEEQDPSIEEILDSIRQIISDDEEEDDSEESQDAEAEEEPEADQEPEEDVIDLTDEVEPEPEDEPDDEPEEAPKAAAPPPPPPKPPAPKPTKKEPIDVIMEDHDDSDDEEESILTRNAETAALKGFSEVVRKTTVEHNGITLEEIVRTELRPLLKHWLDDNLPSIIERLVQDELERLSKRALEE